MLTKKALHLALKGVQSAGAKLGNLGWQPVPSSKSHDLLKAAWMAQQIEDGARVLDVGGGNGRRLMDLSLYVRDLQGVAIEIQPVKPPRPAVPSMRVPELAVFDGQTIPFEDDAFDLCLICYVLHHLKDAHAEALLLEACRVARTRILLLEDSRPRFSTAYRLRNWAHATEANLEYAERSEHFVQNFRHTMFKTHAEWRALLESLAPVAHVECHPLDSISAYRHHTLFVAHLHAPPA